MSSVRIDIPICCEHPQLHFEALPTWFNQYRDLITNTGGNVIEDLLQRLRDTKNLMATNVVVASLGMMVQSQWDILRALHARGLLIDRDDERQIVPGVHHRVLIPPTAHVEALWGVRLSADEHPLGAMTDEGQARQLLHDMLAETDPGAVLVRSRRYRWGVDGLYFEPWQVVKTQTPAHVETAR